MLSNVHLSGHMWKALLERLTSTVLVCNLYTVVMVIMLHKQTLHAKDVKQKRQDKKHIYFFFNSYVFWNLHPEKSFSTFQFLVT